VIATSAKSEAAIWATDDDVEIELPGDRLAVSVRDPAVESLSVSGTATVGALNGGDIDADAIVAQENIRMWAGQGGGWDDMLGQIIARATGAGNPSFSQMGSSSYFAYKFALNDVVYLIYHIPHQYAPGTDIYFHAHWTTNGTNVNPVKWEFDYTYAKGYDQDTFDMNANTQSKSLAASGVAWRSTARAGSGVPRREVARPVGPCAG
jgi:hypothetical protein